MRPHKFQKQNRIGSSKPAIPTSSAFPLCSPQFQTYPQTSSPPRPTLGVQQQQPSPLPVFHLQTKKLMGSTTQRTKKADILSVLDMSFSEDTARQGETATFKGERSSVTSVSGRSRFTESKLQRKSVAFQIFNAIKQSQENLEERQKKIIKALGFKPVRSTISESKWKKPEMKVSELLAEKLSNLKERHR